MLFSGDIAELANSYALHVTQVDSAGNPVFPSAPAAPPSSATLSTVACNAATATTLLAANTARKGFILHNDTGKALFVGFAATVTDAAFTARIGANSFWESPIGGYTGIVSGILKSGTGDVQVTELT